jgi:sulfate adenylyltransferase
MHKILDEREQCDLECLTIGAFNPLNTYMSKAQYDSCLDTMRMDDLTVFPIPITCSVPTEVSLGTVIELRSATGVIRGSLTVSECWPIDLERECTAVFGCFDSNHPYIQYQMSKSDRFYVSGTLDSSSTPYHNTFLSYRKTPSEIKSSASSPLIGFQTRNPLHRSHMELIMNCSKKVPGATVLLHPVEGVTQECDIPFPVRMKCYQEVLPYLPQSLLSILPLSMRMAGPREAVWHAVIRRNYGCTHFIVGRDHAGPSYKKKDGAPFFHPMAAQELALRLESELGIIILASEEVVYCEDLEQYVEISKAPVGETLQTISGTAFRNALEKNLPIPSWYSYPGVVRVLQPFYQRPKGSCYYFVGLSGSGKSTLAEILQSHLEEVYPSRQITLLDADIIRTHLSKGLGFSKEDRSMNVRRIGYVASEIVRHGGLVIVANIAPFEEDREWNRKMISQWGDYIQIYVDTPVEECERRDVKGLYKAARAGTLKNFTGVSDPFEVPTNSFLTLPLQSLQKTTSMMFKSLIPFFEK